MGVIAKQESLIDTLDRDAIWSAATSSGELTKLRLGEAIRDMFGEGLKTILLDY